MGKINESDQRELATFAKRVEEAWDKREKRAGGYKRFYPRRSTGV